MIYPMVNKQFAIAPFLLDLPIKDSDFQQLRKRLPEGVFYP